MSPDQNKPSESPSYDFILQAETPNTQSPWQRLNKKVLVIIGAALLFIIVVVMMILSSMSAQASDQQKKRLLGIAEQQTEIIRVAEIGSNDSSNTKTQARAQAIKDSLESSLNDTNQLLQARGFQPAEDELNAAQNSATDQALKKADAYGNFDKTFEKIIDTQLLEYQRAVLAAQKSGNQQEQQLLGSAYDEANSILGLVDQR